VSCGIVDYLDAYGAELAGVEIIGTKGPAAMGAERPTIRLFSCASVFFLSFLWTWSTSCVVRAADFCQLFIVCSDGGRDASPKP
jgi:hypothetical protein